MFYNLLFKLKQIKSMKWSKKLQQILYNTDVSNSTEKLLNFVTSGSCALPVTNFLLNNFLHYNEPMFLNILHANFLFSGVTKEWDQENKIITHI